MTNLLNITQLLNEVQTITTSYHRVAEATGDNFNIFSVLRIETDEVKTHSRFIAELLNPKGVHGQGDIFLQFFLESLDCGSFDVSTTQVQIEHRINNAYSENDGGQIDILLKDGVGNIIMIENKIYAGEQARQLERYHTAYPNGRLFYLTLFGDQSSHHMRFDKYIPISYQEDILIWLEYCRKETVNMPTLRETLSQYINLIKKLTHQNPSIKMSQDIIKRITRDKESYDAYTSLTQIEHELKKSILDESFHFIVEEIKKKNKCKIRS